MSVEPNLTESEEPRTSSHRPSAALLAFLDDEIKKTEDFYNKLKADYAESVYETFENDFTTLRKRFKDKLQLISDPDHEFLNHSDLRKQEVERIINFATQVAERFQEARENKRLDRTRTKDALEYVINAIKNLRVLSKKE